MIPDAGAPKARWRTWARTLDPVADATARAVSEHLRSFLTTIDGPVLGYLPLPDEVAIDVHVDAVASLDQDRELTIGDVDVNDIAVVLVPARVFDGDGYRLGRGGGHYDRLVPRLRTDTPVIGVTCAARIVERLPRESHDRPMTHLATERGVTPVRPGSEHHLDLDGEFGSGLE